MAAVRIPRSRSRWLPTCARRSRSSVVSTRSRRPRTSKRCAPRGPIAPTARSWSTPRRTTASCTCRSGRPSPGRRRGRLAAGARVPRSPTDRPRQSVARSCSACVIEDPVAVAPLDLDPAESGEQRQCLVHSLTARADEAGEILLGHRQPELLGVAGDLQQPLGRARRDVEEHRSASDSSVLRSRRASSRTIIQSSVGCSSMAACTTS